MSYVQCTTYTTVHIQCKCGPFNVSYVQCTTYVTCSDKRDLIANANFKCDAFLKHQGSAVTYAII